MEAIGEHVAAARARGDEVAGDLYLYTAGGTGLDATIPSWAFDGGDAALKNAWPILRFASVSSMTSRLVRQDGGTLSRQPAVGTASCSSTRCSGQIRKYEGKSMTVIGKEMGKSPADAAFDLVEQAPDRVLAVFHMMSEPDIETALRFPWTSIGSDSGSSLVAGGPADLNHPRAYGNFPASSHTTSAKPTPSPSKTRSAR